MIRHHPTDATLIGCASGILLPLHRQVVGIHLARCPQCPATVGLGEELGGALLDETLPIEMSPGALKGALRLLDVPAPKEPKSVTALTPEALERLTEQGRWRRVGVGIKLMPLVPRDETGTRLDLIRVAPGVALPEHDHTGPEITCVLHGAFADETGEYGAYDVAEGDVGLEHRPRALPGEECICLIATTGYLRARSLIARLLQPVFGI
ncbi:MAG: ChrR family anti-sigma-E factor [Acidobacteriota bacterium]